MQKTHFSSNWLIINQEDKQIIIQPPKQKQVIQEILDFSDGYDLLNPNSSTN